jgi:hypothetical protein
MSGLEPARGGVADISSKHDEAAKMMPAHTIEAGPATGDNGLDLGPSAACSGHDADRTDLPG